MEELDGTIHGSACPLKEFLEGNIGVHVLVTDVNGNSFCGEPICVEGCVLNFNSKGTYKVLDITQLVSAEYCSPCCCKKKKKKKKDGKDDLPGNGTDDDESD